MHNTCRSCTYTRTSASRQESVRDRRERVARETTRGRASISPSYVDFSASYARPKGAKLSKSARGLLSSSGRLSRAANFTPLAARDIIGRSAPHLTISPRSLISPHGKVVATCGKLHLQAWIAGLSMRIKHFSPYQFRGPELKINLRRQR